MLLTLAVLLFAAWALGLIAFDVTSSALHLLLVLALIAGVYHFVRGSRGVRV